jgi:hypothetical protein
MKHQTPTLAFLIPVFLLSALLLSPQCQAGEMREERFTIELSDSWLRSSKSVLGEVLYESAATRESLTIFVFPIEHDRVAITNQQATFEKMVRMEHSKARNQTIDPASAAVSEPVFSVRRGYYTVFSPAENMRIFTMWSIKGAILTIFTHSAIGMKEPEFDKRAQSLAASLTIHAQ